MFIANWKMNGSQAMATSWLEGMNRTLDKSLQDKCVFCPPACFLTTSSEIIEKENLNIHLGAQNIDPHNFSPLTGGIEGSMLKEIGTEYVIIGHSERREIYNEGNKLLLNKMKSASKEGLKVIFCVGETLKEKEENKTSNILKEQLNILSKAELNEFIVAYEPVWAIGSGETAKLDYIRKVHAEIINEVNGLIRNGFLGVSYGGSVDSSSSKEILSLEEVQGLLIGGASLKYEEFSNIVKNNN